MTTEQLYLDSVLLLSEMIRIPSFSREEQRAADFLAVQMGMHGLVPERLGNNLWVRNRFYDPLKPTLLLNSHLDTVRPAGNWSSDPFAPVMNGEKLIGLGANDAGASLVALLAAFRYFYAQELPFNLVFAATAEEEISGSDGIERAFPHFGKIDFAIVAEPTGMNAAVAEKGLLVLDCVTEGKTGHAARSEGENAIAKSLSDLRWFSEYRFERASQWLGETTMSVTMINAGTQHNVVPGSCSFTVDIRVTDAYALDEIVEIVRNNVQCRVQPRSMRLRSSQLDESHVLFQTARALNKTVFGSPTLSDQALLPVPSIKMGPGESARSHTAGEFILLPELRAGIEGYIEFISSLTTQHFFHEALAEKYNG